MADLLGSDFPWPESECATVPYHFLFCGVGHENSRAILAACPVFGAPARSEGCMLWTLPDIVPDLHFLPGH